MPAAQQEVLLLKKKLLNTAETLAKVTQQNLLFTKETGDFQVKNLLEEPRIQSEKANKNF